MRSHRYHQKFFQTTIQDETHQTLRAGHDERRNSQSEHREYDSSVQSHIPPFQRARRHVLRKGSSIPIWHCKLAIGSWRARRLLPPISNQKMKIGSNTIFNKAPIKTEHIAIDGRPCALIKAFKPVDISTNRVPSK